VRVGRLHHQRCRSNWADARDLRQSPAQGIGAVPSHELCLDRLQFDLHLRIVATERCKQFARQGRHAVVARSRGQERCDLVQTFGFDQPELCRITADRVAQLRTPRNQLVADAQQHQRRLLLNCLHRHESHPRPARRLAQSLRIAPVVLVSRHIGLHQLRRDQLYGVPQFAKLPRQVMSGPARLDRDNRWRQLGKKC
jgi:hypothetical protein